MLSNYSGITHQWSREQTVFGTNAYLLPYPVYVPPEEQSSDSTTNLIKFNTDLNHSCEMQPLLWLANEVSLFASVPLSFSCEHGCELHTEYESGWDITTPYLVNSTQDSIYTNSLVVAFNSSFNGWQGEIAPVVDRLFGHFLFTEQFGVEVISIKCNKSKLKNILGGYGACCAFFGDDVECQSFDKIGITIDLSSSWQGRANGNDLNFIFPYHPDSLISHYWSQHSKQKQFEMQWQFFDEMDHQKSNVRLNGLRQCHGILIRLVLSNKSILLSAVLNQRIQQLVDCYPILSQHLKAWLLYTCDFDQLKGLPIVADSRHLEYLNTSVSLSDMGVLLFADEPMISQCVKVSLCAQYRMNKIKGLSLNGDFWLPLQLQILQDTVNYLKKFKSITNERLIDCLSVLFCKLDELYHLTESTNSNQVVSLPHCYESPILNYIANYLGGRWQAVVRAWGSKSLRSCQLTVDRLNFRSIGYLNWFRLNNDEAMIGLNDWEDGDGNQITLQCYDSQKTALLTSVKELLLTSNPIVFKDKVGCFYSKTDSSIQYECRYTTFSMRFGENRMYADNPDGVSKATYIRYIETLQNVFDEGDKQNTLQASLFRQ